MPYIILQGSYLPTNRHTDGQTEIYRQTDRQSNKKMGRQVKRQTDRHTVRQNILIAFILLLFFFSMSPRNIHVVYHSISSKLDDEFIDLSIRQGFYHHSANFGRKFPCTFVRMFVCSSVYQSSELLIYIFSTFSRSLTYTCICI